MSLLAKDSLLQLLASVQFKDFFKISNFALKYKESVGFFSLQNSFSRIEC